MPKSTHLETRRRNFGYGVLSVGKYAHTNSSQSFNIPDKFLGDFPEGTTYGKGAFREARLLVDGQLAGIAFPYVAIYTGGYVPAAWRWVAVPRRLRPFQADSSAHRPIPSYGVRLVPTTFFAKIPTPLLGV